MVCYNCANEIVLDGMPTRQATCPNCNAFLHCCKNCRFFDIKAHNQCREPQADWVRDKELSNFCHYFQRSDKKPSTRNDRRKDALEKLNDLFKK